LEACLRAAVHKESLHLRLGNTKLAALVLGLVLAWLALKDRLFSPIWLLVPIVSFSVLSVLHEKILRSRSQAERAAAFYRRGLARLEDRWAGSGKGGERFRNATHVYAEDLDLFGQGSLFELLSAARTPMGEARLAQWLTTPSSSESIAERQRIVAELRERLDLRQRLALAGEELNAQWNPEDLIAWAEAAPALPLPALRGAAATLALAALAAFLYWLRTWVAWPLIGVLILETILHFLLRRRALAAIANLDSNPQGLDLFSQTMRQLESEPFVTPELRRFSDELKGQARAASRSIRKLARISYWIEARDSFMVRPFDLPLLYTVQLGYAAESWRRRSGRRMRSWIDLVGEMEALLSLAGYSYEHPADPFPEFTPGGPVFLGDDLGHPLIPSSRCVRNTVRLDRDTRMLLVSGSNMSGKSTLLRAVGINAVLAMAGAPVRASALRLTPCSLGARIRTTDSLQESRSGFYTEILRIRRVFDLTSETRPLLFLFDELLEGTNSKDRRVGAEGLLRALFARGAIGIVTTHDLALTEMVDSLDHAVRNAHFQDYVENGQMRFDYRLRPGVVARSNSLELMRLIGLEV
jgi:hypothetical protein